MQKEACQHTIAGMHPVNIGKFILTDTEIKPTAREAARANKPDRGGRNNIDTREAYTLF